MNRDGQTLTVSITLLQYQRLHDPLNPANAIPMHMHYLDIPGGKTFHHPFFTPAISPAI
jgi:hypothetical protein